MSRVVIPLAGDIVILSGLTARTLKEWFRRIVRWKFAGVALLFGWRRGGRHGDDVVVEDLGGKRRCQLAVSR